MGKNKRATRKELEDIVREIIGELGRLRTAFSALDSYVGLYVEWKGDKITFPQYLQSKFENKEGSVEPLNVESNKKGEKRSRYKKVSAPIQK